MECRIQGCPGEYENKMIAHVVTKNGQAHVFEHVPAEVCSVCGDTLLTPETTRKLERQIPERFVTL